MPSERVKNLSVSKQARRKQRLQLKQALKAAKGNHENTRQLADLLNAYGKRIAQVTECLKDCRELLKNELDANVLQSIDDVIANKPKEQALVQPANLPAQDPSVPVSDGNETQTASPGPA